MIFVGGSVSAQISKPFSRPFSLVNYTLKSIPLRFSARDVQLGTHISVPQIAADYYSKNLSFFCKQELKIEKILKFPLLFRLGSVESCNYLEGKHR